MEYTDEKEVKKFIQHATWYDVFYVAHKTDDFMVLRMNMFCQNFLYYFTIDGKDFICYRPLQKFENQDVNLFLNAAIRVTHNTYTDFILKYQLATGAHITVNKNDEDWDWKINKFFDIYVDYMRRASNKFFVYMKYKNIRG